MFHLAFRLVQRRFDNHAVLGILLCFQPSPTGIVDKLCLLVRMTSLNLRPQGESNRRLWHERKNQTNGLFAILVLAVVAEMTRFEAFREVRSLLVMAPGKTNNSGVSRVWLLWWLANISKSEDGIIGPPRLLLVALFLRPLPLSAVSKAPYLPAVSPCIPAFSCTESSSTFSPSAPSPSAPSPSLSCPSTPSAVVLARQLIIQLFLLLLLLLLSGVGLARCWMLGVEITAREVEWAE